MREKLGVHFMSSHSTYRIFPKIKLVKLLANLVEEIF